MDPNATLKEMLELAKPLYETTDEYMNESTNVVDACRLAELVMALDGWMRQGGFAPEAWRAK